MVCRVLRSETGPGGKPIQECAIEQPPPAPAPRGIDLPQGPPHSQVSLSSPGFNAHGTQKVD